MTDEKALEVLENTMIIYDSPKLDTDYTEFGEALENAIRALREKLQSSERLKMNKKEAEILDWEFEELLRNIVSAYLKLRRFESFKTCLDTHGEVKEIYDITITKRAVQND